MSDPPRAGPGGGERALFVALILLHLVPLWWFSRFPSQDGPPHLFNASLIRSYDNAAAESYREYFELNRRPDPTWFGHLLLTLLQTLLPPLIAEKVLLSVYTVLLPLGARYALRAVDPRAGPLAVLIFPFVHNYFVHMGFYGFSMSLAVAFFTLGYWWRHADHLTLRRLVGLAGLTLLLYLNHIFSLALVWIALALLATARLVGDLAGPWRADRLDLARVWTAVRDRALLPLAAFLPTLLLVGFFLLPRRVARSAGKPPGERLWDLVHLITAASFDQRELWLTAALALVFGFVAFHLLVGKLASGERDGRDALLLVLLVFLALYFTVDETELATPNAGAGGALFHLRLNPWPYFVLLLWFAAQRWSRVLMRLVRTAAVVLALGLLGLHVSRYRLYNAALEDLLTAAPLLEPGATLLALDISDGSFAARERDLTTRLGNTRIDPLEHATHYLALERGVVPLDNYEAALGYFPVLFRPERNPYVAIGEIERRLPEVWFLDYPERTGGRLDYVLLRLGRRALPDHPNSLRIADQLERRYDRVHVSPRGLFELYRRRGRAQGG